MATPAPASKKPADKSAVPAAEAAAPHRKKKSKVLLFSLVGVLVLALAAGGAAWFLLRPKDGAEPKAVAHKPEKKAEKARPPIYVSMETFTVNLQAEHGEHLLQTTFSLKVSDEAVEQAIKQNLPEVRSRLLLLLSSKRPSELGSVEGKQALANEIAADVNRVLNPAAAKPEAGAAGAAAAEPAAGPVASVFFTNFIIQ